MLALLVCPYFFSPIVVAANKRKWRPPKKEVADSFISCLKDTSEIKPGLERKRTKYLSLNVKCQAIVFLVGADIDSLKGYVAIDDVIYFIESPIRSFDVCFKISHTLFANYPVESAHVWQFVQLYLYNLKTEWDKSYPSIPSLIADLEVNL